MQVRIWFTNDEYTNLLSLCNDRHLKRGTLIKSMLHRGVRQIKSGISEFKMDVPENELNLTESINVVIDDPITKKFIEDYQARIKISRFLIVRLVLIPVLQESLKNIQEVSVQ